MSAVHRPIPGSAISSVAGVVVGQGGHPRQVQPAVRDPRCELGQVSRFLAGQARCGHARLAERRDRARRHRARGPDQAPIRGFGGGQRDLLLKDDADQRRKARVARPERRRSVPLDDPAEPRVQRGDDVDGAQEPRFVESRGIGIGRHHRRRACQKLSAAASQPRKRARDPVLSSPAKEGCPLDGPDGARQARDAQRAGRPGRTHRRPRDHRSRPCPRRPAPAARGPREAHRRRRSTPTTSSSRVPGTA